MKVPRSPSEFVARLRNRSLSTAARAYLSLRLRLNGGPFLYDRSPIKLPFCGDGDAQEVEYYIHGKEWWESECQNLSPYLTQGCVAIDAGANHGFVSGILSTLTGATGRVYSFEPSPVTYARLLTVIDANHYTNISPYNMACGSVEGRMTLYCSENHSGHSTLRPEVSLDKAARKGQSAHKVNVQIVKLDDFLGPKLKRLDFMKLDVEGFEDEVLAGAVGLLREFKPVIYIELCQQFLKSSHRAVSLLRGYGYAFDHESELFNSPTGRDFFALPPGFQARVQAAESVPGEAPAVVG